MDLQSYDYFLVLAVKEFYGVAKVKKSANILAELKKHLLIPFKSIPFHLVLIWCFPDYLGKIHTFSCPGPCADARNLDWDIYEIINPYYLFLEIVKKNFNKLYQ